MNSKLSIIVVSVILLSCSTFSYASVREQVKNKDDNAEKSGPWRSSANYPEAALKERREGTTFYTLKIDENGNVTNCIITRSSGSDDLDSETCQMMRLRARFQPAHDEDGKPIPGAFSSKVKWEIP